MILQSLLPLSFRNEIPICGIDPGASGGIAFYANERTVSAIPMPGEPKELWEYFNFLRDTYGHYIVFIERVNVWRGDSSTPGKDFGIAKMLQQYAGVTAIIKALGLPLIEVASISWQKELNLYQKTPDKTLRKNAYKRYAAKKYPTLKPTLKTADALCIMSYGRVKSITSASWVKDRIANKDTLSLFAS